MNKSQKKERRKDRKTYQVISKNKQALPIVYLDKSCRHLFGCVNLGSKTLYTFSSKTQDKPSYNVIRAVEMGKEMAIQLKKLNVKDFIINTCGNKYHGRIKAFIENMRGENNGQ